MCIVKYCIEQNVLYTTYKQLLGIVIKETYQLYMYKKVNEYEYYLLHSDSTYYYYESNLKKNTFITICINKFK